MNDMNRRTNKKREMNEWEGEMNEIRRGDYKESGNEWMRKGNE